jgi:NAD-dependent SIR2 family protein deacetylase
MKQSGKEEKSPAVHEPDTCHDEDCVYCRLKKPFELPSEIVEAYRKGKLIIFAGAGVSTEGSGVYPSSFYTWVKKELNLPEQQQISFSKLMSLFCAPPRNRKNLLQAIKKRLDYVRTFPDLYQQATAFHRQLSTIPHLDEIFTTNWDDFFERECNATPVVTSEDYAVLEDIPGRKIFKLHGSIYNFGSIVATEKQYSECYKELSVGLIGAKLKLLLMSKTVVFFGYSFTDEDFQKIYRVLNKETKGLVPRSYVVTLDEHANEKLKELGINAAPIITSAAYFVEQFKNRLVKEKLMVPDDLFEGVEEKLTDIYEKHFELAKLGLHEHPDSMYSLAYQDGLIHAFERLLTTKNSGENSCATHMLQIIKLYDDTINSYIKKRDYWNASYFIGYQLGLYFFLSNEEQRRELPSYFIFGCDDSIMTLQQYIQLEKKADSFNKTAHQKAEKKAKSVKNGIVLQHTPFG